MNNSLIALLTAAGVGFAAAAVAQNPRASSAAPMSKTDYAQAVKDADGQYSSARDACNSLSGNAKDICVAEAAGKQKIAKAEAEAAYQNTPKAHEEARIARAEANYKVAAERCDDLAGNPKDVCVREAQATLAKAKADARADRVTADTNREAASAQAAARNDANEEKREADLRVALQKCDALAGDAKETCVSTARSKYGKR